MTEDEKIDIHEVVMRLEDVFWVSNYLETFKGERFKRIHEAIEILKKEHNELYASIKED